MLTGSGNGPIYFDDLSTYNAGNYYPVQFCLQSDNTFVVQNLGDVNNPNDDANIVQMCGPNNILELHNPTVAASSSNCNTVRLQIAQAPPGYYAVTTTTSTTSSSTTSSQTSTATVQRFRIRRVSNGQYLADSDPSRPPTISHTLIGVLDAVDAVIFTTVPGGNGQITMYAQDGSTLLFSNQDPGGTGRQPIYFDSLPFNQNGNYQPVYFNLNNDDSFDVRNPGADLQDSSDDATVVAICSDGVRNILFLFTANGLATTAATGCVQDTLYIDRVP